MAQKCISTQILLRSREVFMISIKAVLCILVVTISCSISYAFVINSEFVDPSLPADSVYHKWVSAGSNAVIDSVFTINVRAIPDSAYYAAGDSIHFIHNALPNDNLDDHLSFQKQCFPFFTIAIMSYMCLKSYFKGESYQGTNDS